MKPIISKEEVKKYLFDGMSIMVGGFMNIGTPEVLVEAIIDAQVKDITVICNDAGLPSKGVGRLIEGGIVKKLIASHIGLNPLAGKLMSEEKLDVELVPQGSLAEKIRAAGAGLGGVLTPTGLNTMVAENKEVIVIDEKEYLLELPIKADLAILYGTTVDRYGNVLFTKTTRNFNPVMATAAETVIVQARELIDEMNPDHIHTPHIFIDYIVMEEENNG